MLQDSHPDHYWHQLWSEPSDFGFGGTARRRTWVMGAHAELTRPIEDPDDLLEAIKSSISEDKPCEVQDYLIATDAEINMESMNVAISQNLTHFSPGSTPMSLLLTHREAKAMAELDVKYFIKTGQRSNSARNLVYNLADSGDWQSWSAVSGKVPTYRLNQKSSKYWLPALQRWMTSKERLVSMGFPVCREVASSMRAPIIGAADAMRASDLLGNCMHFQSCGIFQLIALSSYGPQRWMNRLCSIANDGPMMMHQPQETDFRIEFHPVSKNTASPFVWMLFFGCSLTLLTRHVWKKMLPFSLS